MGCGIRDDGFGRRCLMAGLGCSALLDTQTRAIDLDGVTAFAQAAEQRIDQRLVAEEIRPGVVRQIRGDDRWPAVMPLFHQFEENVGLFGSEVQIAEFIDLDDVDLGKAIDQLARGTVGQ